MSSGDYILLAGDIGGTKTHLAVYTSGQGLRSPLAEARLPSKNYPSLQTLVKDFAKDFDFRFNAASFGVAGPVVGGRATVTNLPWVLDEEGIREELGLSSVQLLNDLAAMAKSVPHLKDEELQTVKTGKAVPGGPIAVIAPGTGLGEAYMTWDGSRYHAHASEGGHADFAPSNELERDLLGYLHERHGHVSFERVCSGKGMPNIYAYLKSTGWASEPSWLTERLASIRDPVPVIVNAALDDVNPCELCRATLRAFVAILASEAGNMALKVLATGGVYLGGGIPPRILSFLSVGGFIERFQNKGRLSTVLERIPVRVIMHPSAALLGAACHGLESAGAKLRGSD